MSEEDMKSLSFSKETREKLLTFFKVDHAPAPASRLRVHLQNYVNGMGDVHDAPDFIHTIKLFLLCEDWQKSLGKTGECTVPPSDVALIKEALEKYKDENPHYQDKRVKRPLDERTLDEYGLIPTIIHVLEELLEGHQPMFRDDLNGVIRQSIDTASGRAAREKV